LIHDVSVAKHCSDLGLGNKDPCQYAQLPVMPYVVLIREEDELAFTQLDDALEVLRMSKSRVVYVNADRKWRSGTKPLQDSKSAVGRAIVTHYDFIWQAGLACDAL
jgi:hypothetical protein